MRLTIPAGLIALSCVAMPAQARETRYLKPSSKWVVDYAKDSCNLARSFGGGKQLVTLIFRQFAPGDDFEMTFVGNPMYVANSGEMATVLLRFGPGEEESRETALPATVNGTPALIVHGSQRIGPLTPSEEAAVKAAAERNAPIQLPPVGPARERSVTWVQLAKILPFDLVLETGPMDKPFDALRACSWDTVKSWGLDVDQQKHLSRPATPTRNPVSWFSPNDYPYQMLVAGHQAVVNFRVMINADGTPSSCHIQQSTRPQAFDQAVCKQVMKDAKFVPALDAQGHPVASFWRQTVTFRIE